MAENKTNPLAEFLDGLKLSSKQKADLLNGNIDDATAREFAANIVEREYRKADRANGDDRTELERTRADLRRERVMRAIADERPDMVPRDLEEATNRILGMIDGREVNQHGKLDGTVDGTFHVGELTKKLYGKSPAANGGDVPDGYQPYDGQAAAMMRRMAQGANHHERIRAKIEQRRADQMATDGHVYKKPSNATPVSKHYDRNRGQWLYAYSDGTKEYKDY